MPIIIHLKHLLEEKHSPLLGPLMQYLTDMMKDYKNEISGTASASFFTPSVVVVDSRTRTRALSVPHLLDIMTGDKQLAKELDYDLRQYNIEKTRKKRMSLMAFSPAVARQGLAVPVASPMVRHVAASPMRSVYHVTHTMHAPHLSVWFVVGRIVVTHSRFFVSPMFKRPSGASAGMPFASPSALPFASPQGKTLSVPKLRNSLAGSVTSNLPPPPSHFRHCRLHSF